MSQDDRFMENPSGGNFHRFNASGPSTSDTSASPQRGNAARQVTPLSRTLNRDQSQGYLEEEYDPFLLNESPRSSLSPPYCSRRSSGTSTMSSTSRRSSSSSLYEEMIQYQRQQNILDVSKDILDESSRIVSQESPITLPIASGTNRRSISYGTYRTPIARRELFSQQKNESTSRAISSKVPSTSPFHSSPTTSPSSSGMLSSNSLNNLQKMEDEQISALLRRMADGQDEDDTSAVMEMLVQEQERELQKYYLKSNFVHQGERLTLRALEQERTRVARCYHCHQSLHIPVECAMFYCPVCRTTCPN